jgi:Uma2 family endonuclease
MSNGFYKRDYEDKSKQYGAIGVPEYWIIDPDRTCIRVGTLVDARTSSKTSPGCKLSSLLRFLN